MTEIALTHDLTHEVEMQLHEDPVFLAKALCFLHAFSACDDDTKQIVRDMAEIIASAETDKDDKYFALNTAREALFPRPLAVDLAECAEHDRGDEGQAREVMAEFQNEQHVFSERLSVLMAERGLTQRELADRIGVGQPAISLMLSRECRPQRRTIERLAKALDVEPEDLWPSTAR